MESNEEQVERTVTVGELGSDPDFHWLGALPQANLPRKPKRRVSFKLEEPIVAEPAEPQPDSEPEEPQPAAAPDPEPATDPEPIPLPEPEPIEPEPQAPEVRPKAARRFRLKFPVRSEVDQHVSDAQPIDAPVEEPAPQPDIPPPVQSSQPVQAQTIPLPVLPVQAPQPNPPPVQAPQPDQRPEAEKPVDEQGPEHARYVSWQPKRVRVTAVAKENSEQLIFIAIASYRDTELLPTLRSIMDNARWPERLRFGICLQNEPAELNAFPYYGDTRFRILRVHSGDSKGCCWARAQMQTLYGGERYYLQLDSHHRFVADWDVACLRMLHSCRSRKPLLSTYLPPYKPETEHTDVTRTDLFCIAMTGYSKRGLVMFRPQRISDAELPVLEPRLSSMIAAGFIFTFAEWMREVPYDAQLYFNGEEISLTVRSWTRGWDIFVPNEVVAFHYYERSREPKHWTDHADSWQSVNAQSISRVIDQLSSRGEDSIFGLGKERTLAQYQAFAGLDLQKKQLSPEALQGRTELDVRNGNAARPPSTELQAELLAAAKERKPTARLSLIPKTAPTKATVPKATRPPAPLKSALRPTNSAAPISTNRSLNLFPAPTDPVQRHRIDYTNGYIVKDKSARSRQWYEYKNGERFATFQQLPAGKGELLLFDSERNLHLRIDGKGQCQFAQGEQDAQNLLWRNHFRGQWTA